MSYSIIFETKIVSLTDGRILHFERKGCNNDDEGRDRGDFSGKIYTEEEFVQLAEELKLGSVPIEKSEGFDLKIGNRWCTLYDYGEHLLRMLKRKKSFLDLKKERHCYGTVFEGVTLTENGITSFVKADEWNVICYDFIYGRRKGKIATKYRSVYTEEEIVNEIEKGSSIRFFLGKKISNKMAS